MINSEIISQVLMIVAVLVVLVNIITEVAKNTCKIKDAQKINIFVTCLSILLTIGTFITYYQIMSMPITWYCIAGFVIVGFMVAYGAMFGYDKLISYFKDIKK